MSYLEPALSACKDLQMSLDKAWGNASWLVNEELPLLDYTTSAENRLNTIISPGRGKTRTVEVVHSQRYLESDVTEVSELGCSATTPPDEATNTYELDINVIDKHERFIDETTLAEFCGENPALFQKTVMQMIDVLRRKIATRQATKVATLNGTWASDVTTTNDSFVVATENTDGTPKQSTMADIDLAMMKTGYTLPSVIMGQSDLYSYYRLMLHGCCANSGLDLGGIMRDYGKAVMYDRRLATALTGTDATNLLIQQNSLQVLNYSRAGWKEGVNEANISAASDYILMAVRDPRTGLLYDLIIKDECPGKISLVLHAVTDTVGLPSNLYRVGDPYYGVNFVGGIKVDNT